MVKMVFKIDIYKLIMYETLKKLKKKRGEF